MLVLYNVHAFISVYDYVYVTRFNIGAITLKENCCLHTLHTSSVPGHT